MSQGEGGWGRKPLRKVSRIIWMAPKGGAMLDLTKMCIHRSGMSKNSQALWLELLWTKTKKHENELT